MWDIKLKCIDTDKSGGYQREEESGGSKGNKIHGDGRWLDFGWWAHMQYTDDAA